MTAPVTHPGWCSSGHDPAVWPVHTTDVGEDVDLGNGASLFVELMQPAGELASLILGIHTEEETTTLGLSRDQAMHLRDLLDEALGLLAREAGLR